MALPNVSAIFFDYISLQSFLIFGVSFLIIYHLFTREKPVKLPPGPPCLPLIGNVHRLLGGRQRHIVMAKMSDKFGGIMNINVLGKRVVLLTDLQLIREAFLDKTDRFSDRVQSQLGEYIWGFKGSLVFGNGKGWKYHRRTTLRALRNFGMGKRSLENKINEEARYLARSFEDESGRPFNPQPTVENAVSNVICSISFGNRYEYDDPEFRSLLDYIKMFMSKLAVPSIVSKIPKLWVTPFYKSLKKQTDECISFLRGVVEHHKATFDSNDIRDIIDVHLQDNDDECCTEEKLPRSLIWRGIFDLFAAGTDTTSNAILWAMLLLTQYPHVQEKAQQEIDDLIGRERPPSLPDRLHLPYVDATLMEIQRFRPVGCFVPPRAASVDTELRGYTILKGTPIWVNLYAVLHSPKHWTDPEEFIPERFLSADGKKTETPEAFIPFGLGSRICIGEQLARMELFLFMTNLLQRFTFKIPKEDPKPNLAGELGITLSPGRFRICAVNR
ncbi:cytochrome P450 2J4-like [Amphiura filiformis]|uniref:cytochrome P450 2J4-like n=1 Tax=Amphiura filiformis TaxID=82378 RepID=UPI003B20BC0E